MPRRQLNALLVQHNDPQVEEKYAWELKFELHALGYKVMRHFRLRGNNATFKLVFGNRDTIEKVYADKKVSELLKKLKFKQLNGANNKNMNLRTVHVNKLSTNFFYKTVRNPPMSLDDCKAELLSDLKSVVGSKVEDIHVYGVHHIGHSAIPSAIDVRFDTIGNALQWLKEETELKLGTIKKQQKKMHHNVSNDICTICRKRNCRKNGCSGIRLCSRCAKQGHTNSNCDADPWCLSCDATGHTTGSARCPLNREYIKKKLEQKAINRRMTDVANGDTMAIGREMVSINRNLSQLMSRPAPLPSQNPWSSVDVDDERQFPSMSQQQQPQVQRNTQEPVPSNRSVIQASQTVGAIEPEGAGFSSAAFRYALIFAAMECQAADYDSDTFQKTLDAMCQKNGIKGMQWLDMSEKTIDHLCGGKNPRSPQPVSRKETSPLTSLGSRSISLRSGSPRSRSSSIGSLSEGRSYISDGHLSGLSGSPLKAMTPLSDLPDLSRSPSPGIDEQIAIHLLDTPKSRNNKTGLTGETSKIAIKQKPRTGPKTIVPTQDLFSSYDKDGKLIQKTSPSIVPAKDSKKEGKTMTSTPLSESQNLAEQCETVGAQSLVEDKTQDTSSPSYSTDGDSKSDYSPLSSKSAPSLDRGIEVITESLREKPIPLQINKQGKRTVLNGKDKATISQIRAALKRKEVSIPRGAEKRISALLDNAAEYSELKGEKFEIKWSRGTSQWQ